MHNINKDREILTSILGTCMPALEVINLVNTLSFGSRTFTAGPPSVPKSWYLRRLNQHQHLWSWKEPKRYLHMIHYNKIYTNRRFCIFPTCGQLVISHNITIVSAQASIKQVHLVHLICSKYQSYHVGWL